MSTSLPLTQLTRSLSLRERVLEELRTAIITGELADGQIVSAPTLGEVLGVSATPVREAMMDLSREGLVETIKNKGFRVTSMTEKQLDDLTAIRLLLEPPVMPQLVGVISSEGYNELELLADKSLKGAEESNMTDYLTSDWAFHAKLLAYAGNEQLVELATSLRQRTRLYGVRGLARENKLASSAGEHYELLRLLRAGDGSGAEALLHRHIARTRSSLATGIEAENEVGATGSPG